MALKRARLLAPLLAALGLLAGSCRGTTLCEQARCVQSDEAAGGNRSSGGNAGSARGGANPEVAGEPAQGGAAGQAEAGAGGAGAPTGLVCPEHFGDCDGSKFTGCEANLEWNHRNCGACGNRCQGGCQDQTCLEALRIGNVMLTSMVSTATLAFAIAAGEPDLLVKIAVYDGELQELAGVPWLAELALGSDRVYVWDRYHDPSESGLSSMQLAGTELKTEPLQGAESFGASQEGAYYVEVDQDPNTVDDVRKLWFRPRADADWELLSQGVTSTEIIASSSAGVVLRRYDAAEEQWHLFMLNGRDVDDYGPAPEGFDEAVANARGITVLSSDSEQSRLSWLSLMGDSKQYPLSSHPMGDGRKLLVRYDEVALMFSEHATTFVQQFDEDGPVRGSIGLPRASGLAFVDAHYIWHHDIDVSITPRLTRSTWFPLEP